MTELDEVTRSIHAFFKHMRDSEAFEASVAALSDEEVADKARELVDVLNVLCTKLADRGIEAELEQAAVQRMGSEVGWTSLSLKLRKVL